MTPTFSLGPWDAPDYEFAPVAINQIIAILIEQYSPLDERDLKALWAYLQSDTLFLKKDTESFFVKLECVCRDVANGKRSRYEAHRIELLPFAGYFKYGVGDGVVSEEAKDSAQGYLTFLGRHPEYWPPHQ